TITLSVSARRISRRMNRLYRTALQPIYDHFGATRYFDARQNYAIKRLDQVGPGGQPREPRGKDDHVIRAHLGHEADDPLLTLPPVRQDLRAHQAHEVNDLTARDEDDGADVVQRQPGLGRQVGVDPMPELHLHRLDVLDTPRVALGGGHQSP